MRWKRVRDRNLPVHHPHPRGANAAIPARLRRNGPGNGFARRCARGERATALRRPRTTGRARTHAGAAAKRSNDYRPENGPRRPLSSICTGAGRRPSPTPSAARERLGVNADEMRTRRLRLAVCDRERRRSPRTLLPFVQLRQRRGRPPALLRACDRLLRGCKHCSRGASAVGAEQHYDRHGS